jgi:hypothetical protein
MANSTSNWLSGCQADHMRGDGWQAHRARRRVHAAPCKQDHRVLRDIVTRLNGPYAVVDGTRRERKH